THRAWANDATISSQGFGVFQSEIICCSIDKSKAESNSFASYMARETIGVYSRNSEHCRLTCLIQIQRDQIQQFVRNLSRVSVSQCTWSERQHDSAVIVRSF